MTQVNHAEVVCIVDRSGSMNAIAEDALGGFNQFLVEQKKLPDPARFTLVLFNHEYELAHDGANLADVPDLTPDAYGISGTTALLDAVGMTLDNVRNRLAKVPDGEQPAGVLVAILTDGLENSSKEYTRGRVFEMIAGQQGKGWEFAFLAANQDAVQEGGRMGVTAADARSYAHTGEGVREAWSGISERAAGTRRRARERGEPSSGADKGTKVGFKAPQDHG